MGRGGYRVGALLAVAGLLVSVAHGLGSCDPIVPENCMFPYPNNFYTEADATSRTGLRLRLTPEMMPMDTAGVQFDPFMWRTLDGFSVMPNILAYFPGNISLANVPGHRDIVRSLDSDSPTILLDAETGLPQPHWAELDVSSGSLDMHALMIWPTTSLRYGARYIVGIRYLHDLSGALILPSAAFKALRDQTSSSDPDIEERRGLFEDIFSKLGAANFRRQDLQLAWDFTTASEHSLTNRQFSALNDALQRVPAAGPSYTIRSYTDDFNANIYRLIEGSMEIPLYMDSPFPNSMLVVDENDNAVYQGMVDVTFTVLIPRILVEEGRSGPVIQYGHGLLGTQDEVRTGYLGEVANRYGYILCACDWQGMSTPDAPFIVKMLSEDLGRFYIIPDRLTQGVLNSVLLMKTVTGRLISDPLVNFGGVSVINPNGQYYYGNSQGGIMGNNYMAISPWVNRGVLGVPGAPYNLMLLRSVDFDMYFSIIKLRYHEPLDRIFLIQFICQLWDRSEPAGYQNVIKHNPSKRVLLQYGLGDAQVSWLSAYANMRGTGARVFIKNVLQPNETLYGFDEVIGETSTGSMGVGYDYGSPPSPVENIPPPKEFDTHEDVRRDVRAQEQMHLFFTTGVIVDTCDGQGCW